MRPQRYLRLRRMRLAHRELRDADPASCAYRTWRVGVASRRSDGSPRPIGSNSANCPPDNIGARHGGLIRDGPPTRVSAQVA